MRRDSICSPYLDQKHFKVQTTRKSYTINIEKTVELLNVAPTLNLQNKWPLHHRNETVEE